MQLDGNVLYVVVCTGYAGTDVMGMYLDVNDANRAAEDWNNTDPSVVYSRGMVKYVVYDVAFNAERIAEDLPF